MKKLLLLALIVGGAVYAYFWYIRGVNLLAREDANPLPLYGIAMRMPAKDAPPIYPIEEYRWFTATPMPTPRSAFATAAIGSRIFVIGGVDGFKRPLDVVEMYDTRSDAWTTLAPLPVAVQRPAVAVMGDMLYVFGGFKGLAETPTDEVFTYDAIGNHWMPAAKMPVPTGAAAAVAVPADHVIHVIGGRSGGTTLATDAIYDPAADEWSPGTEMTVGREMADALLIGRSIYVFGGRKGTAVYPMDDVSALNLDQGVWDDELPRMPRKRAAAAAALLDGKVYVFGGEAATLTFPEVDMFDPVTGAWSTLKEKMAHPRQGLGAEAVDRSFFLIGGGQRAGLSVSQLNEVFAAPVAESKP